ncbi:MAG: hypothetical protein WKG07_49930 [Hymenobacter sp.]
MHLVRDADAGQLRRVEGVGSPQPLGGVDDFLPPALGSCSAQPGRGTLIASSLAPGEIAAATQRPVLISSREALMDELPMS